MLVNAGVALYSTRCAGCARYVQPSALLFGPEEHAICAYCLGKLLRHEADGCGMDAVAPEHAGEAAPAWSCVLEGDRRCKVPTERPVPELYGLGAASVGT